MPSEVESMFYSGATPWHGLGVKVDQLANSEEAIKAAGLNWTVSMQPVYSDNNQQIPGWKAITRDTDGRVFAIMSDSYTPVQNTEAFHFFDSVVNSKEAYYETAGSLRNGSRVWMLANLKSSISIKGDEVKQYLTLVNSHDGSLALQMFWTPIRVVCMNTLAMALSSTTEKFYARHTTNISHRIYNAKEILGFTEKFYTDWIAKATAMAQKALPPAKTPLLLAAAFQTSGAIRPEDVYAPTIEKQRVYNRVGELIVAGRGQDNPSTRGTLWQAYNGIVEYVDYEKKYKDTSVSARLYGAWFGAGAAAKKRAWDWCIGEL